MIAFDDAIKENIKEHNSNWLEIPDHPCRILTVRCSGSGKANSLFNLISQQPDTDIIYLYAKNPYEAKYQYLINKRKNRGLKYFNDSKASIALIALINCFWWYDWCMLSNKKPILIVTELFIRGKKLNICLLVVTQSDFAVPKIIKLNSMHCFIMKISNKRELQQIAFNHSWDIDFEDFVNIYKNSTAKLYSLLVIDATLASDNPLRFRKNLAGDYKN